MLSANPSSPSGGARKSENEKLANLESLRGSKHRGRSTSWSDDINCCPNNSPKEWVFHYPHLQTQRLSPRGDDEDGETGVAQAPENRLCGSLHYIWLHLDSEVGVCVLGAGRGGGQPAWAGFSSSPLESQVTKDDSLTSLYFGCLNYNEELTLLCYCEDEMRYSLEASASGLTYSKCSMNPSDPKNPSSRSVPLWVPFLAWEFTHVETRTLLSLPCCLPLSQICKICSVCAIIFSL